MGDTGRSIERTDAALERATAGRSGRVSRKGEAVTY